MQKLLKAQKYDSSHGEVSAKEVSMVKPGKCYLQQVSIAGQQTPVLLAQLLPGYWEHLNMHIKGTVSNT